MNAIRIEVNLVFFIIKARLIYHYVSDVQKSLLLLNLIWDVFDISLEVNLNMKKQMFCSVFIG